MSEIVFPLVTKHFFISPKNEKNLWGEEWSICFKDGDKENIGSLHFEEAGFHGSVKMFVELDPPFVEERNISEVYYAMSRFIFRFREMREICTFCRHEDDKSVRGLEKAGYVLREFKDGNDYYSITKQKTAWTGAYVIIGMVAGFFIGIMISNLWAGTIAGVLIGTVIGYLMDKREKKDVIESKA